MLKLVQISPSLISDNLITTSIQIEISSYSISFSISMMSVSYLSLVISVVAKFGFQDQDLNISLTAIVLLWNISDYMFQNCDNLVIELNLLVSNESKREKDENSDKLRLQLKILYIIIFHY
jgi:hypothetical protein